MDAVAVSKAIKASLTSLSSGLLQVGRNRRLALRYLCVDLGKWPWGNLNYAGAPVEGYAVTSSLLLTLCGLRLRCGSGNATRRLGALSGCTGKMGLVYHV